MRTIQVVQKIDNLSFFPMSERHNQVFNLVKKGLNVREIAEELNISSAIVRDKLNQIRRYYKNFDGDNSWDKPLSARAARALTCIGIRSRIEARHFFKNGNLSYELAKSNDVGIKTINEIKEWAHYDVKSNSRRYIRIEGYDYGCSAE